MLPRRLTSSAPAPHRRLFPPFTVPLEDLACIALFAFFAMQGSIPGISPPQALEITGSAPSTFTTIGGIASQFAANGIILILLLRRPRLLLRQIPSQPWAALLALLVIASAAWSLDPLFTLRRALPFALAGLYGLYFATRFSPARQLAILRSAMLLLALGTVAIVLLVPSIGLDHSPGHAADWQGIFTQKNACGRIMVLAASVILFADPISGRITLRRLAALALFTFVLIMSGSRGAWLIQLAILLLWITLRCARRVSQRLRLVLAVAAPVLVTIFAAAATVLFPQIARLFGRDPTLTGRTAIWTQVLHFIAHRPLAGYGYDVFWRGMQGPSLQIDAALHFVVEHAHNGFLEILLELGIAGLVLFLLSWIQAWRRLWPLWRAGRIDQVAFPIVILVLIVLYDLDENTLLIHNGLFWTLYVATLARIQSAARDLHHIDSPQPHAILSAQRDLGRPLRTAEFATQESP